MPVRMTIFFLSVGKNTEKENPCTLLVGRQIGTAAMEGHMDLAQKIKTKNTILSSNPNSGLYIQKN